MASAQENARKLLEKLEAEAKRVEEERMSKQQREVPPFTLGGAQAGPSYQPPNPVAELVDKLETTNRLLLCVAMSMSAIALEVSHDPDYLRRHLIEAMRG